MAKQTKKDSGNRTKHSRSYTKKQTAPRSNREGTFNHKVATIQESTDFVYGRHAVREALLQPERVNKLFIQEALSGKEITPLIELAQEHRIHIQNVPKAKLQDLVGDVVHQGVVASIAAYQYATLDDVFAKAAAQEEEPFILILDGIEDPYNLGSILRTADATGVHGIIIPKRRSVALTSTVAKASTGAIEHVPVVRVTNLTQTIEQLKERGVWVFGTDMKGTDYRRWNTAGALALVMGNEGKGVSRLVKDSVDEMLTIPMTGHVQSLNASVASALMMYEVYRGRHGL